MVRLNNVHTYTTKEHLRVNKQVQNIKALDWSIGMMTHNLVIRYYRTSCSAQPIRSLQYIVTRTRINAMVHAKIWQVKQDKHVIISLVQPGRPCKN